MRVAVIALVAILIGSCTPARRLTDDEIESRTESAFYTLPKPLPAGAPGTLIRRKRLLGAPNGSVAWRVLYRSTDLTGAPIGVSGVVVAPTRPAPKDGWPIVSWGHPTTGAYWAVRPLGRASIPSCSSKGCTSCCTPGTSWPQPTSRGWAPTDRPAT